MEKLTESLQENLAERSPEHEAKIGSDAVVEDVPRQRLRVTYARGEAIKFISHQDEFRLWERALRRAGLPLYYKQGFNPQPGLQFAAPLGVGFTANRENVDIILAPPVPSVAFRSALERSLPPGVTVGSIEEIALKADALANTLIGADYSIILYASQSEISRDDVERRIATFLDGGAVWRERERKGERYTYNLRPLVFGLRYEGYDDGMEEHRIFLRVQQRTGATGRPDEVVAALGLDDCARSLCRERLYYASVAEDATLFAGYPVVSQESIAGARLGKVRRGEDRPRERAAAGRTIGERAADEFV